MYLIISRIAKRLYDRIAGLSWDTVLFMTVLHFTVSWGLMALVGGEHHLGSTLSGNGEVAADSAC